MPCQGQKWSGTLIPVPAGGCELFLLPPTLCMPVFLVCSCCPPHLCMPVLLVCAMRCNPGEPVLWQGQEACIQLGLSLGPSTGSLSSHFSFQSHFDFYLYVCISVCVCVPPSVCLCLHLSLSVSLTCVDVGVLGDQKKSPNPLE